MLRNVFGGTTDATRQLPDGIVVAERPHAPYLAKPNFVFDHGHLEIGPLVDSERLARLPWDRDLTFGSGLYYLH